MKIKTTLKEAIIGKVATVFTRHKNPNGLKVVVGEERSGVAILGPGIYCTYEFEDQLNQRMVDNYGEYVYKLGIKIDGFFIFDKTLRDQKQKDSQIYSEKQLEIIKHFEDLTKDDEDFKDWKDDGYLTGVANKYNEIYYLIRRNFNGCIYNREDDGRCALIFNPTKSYTIPYGFAKITDFSIKQNQVVWKK